MSLFLPRLVINDPRRPSVEAALEKMPGTLWEKGLFKVPHVPFTPSLMKALGDAYLSKHLERGLEPIEKILAAEAKGIGVMHERQGSEPTQRISRVLLVLDGGSERFYRTCESLLYRHQDRLLGLRFSTDTEVLSKKIFGEEKTLKALLVTDRDSSARVLLSLATDGLQD